MLDTDTITQSPAERLAQTDAERRSAMTGGTELVETPFDQPREDAEKVREEVFAPLRADELGQKIGEIQAAGRRDYLTQPSGRFEGLDRLAPGDAKVVSPSIREQFHEDEITPSLRDYGVRDSVAVVRAEQALSGLANMLHMSPVVLEAARAKATVAIYNSEQNGAPVIVEATIDMGRGNQAVVRYFTPENVRGQVHDSSVELRKIA